MSDTGTPSSAEPAPAPMPEAVTLPMATPSEVPDWVAAAARPQPARNESALFQDLVKADDDVVGLLAFGLYQLDRRDWLAAWRSNHRAEPTAAEVDAFVTGHAVSGQTERYRAGARQALEAYALAAVEYERPLVAEEAVTARIERAARRVESGGRLARQIGGAIIALVTMAIVLALVVGGLHYFGIDIIAQLRPYFSG